MSDSEHRPAETDSATDHLAHNSSSNTDSNASDHPMHQSEPVKGEKVEIREPQAIPSPAFPKPGPAIPNHGPVIPQNFNVQQEGTKEERRAKTEAMNK